MQEEIKKITNFVYKILDFFPEGDPLKNRAKDGALAILAGEQNIEENIRTLLNYLEIAKNMGWLNSANYLIILNEYKKIKPANKTKTQNTEKSVLKELPARQKKIIEFLEKDKNAQVADLLTILPNITKRTIRRDLDELLKMGQIVRTGEFNQVSYQLAKMS